MMNHSKPYVRVSDPIKYKEDILNPQCLLDINNNQYENIHSRNGTCLVITTSLKTIGINSIDANRYDDLYKISSYMLVLIPFRLDSFLINNSNAIKITNDIVIRILYK